MSEKIVFDNYITIEIGLEYMEVNKERESQNEKINFNIFKLFQYKA